MDNLDDEQVKLIPNSKRELTLHCLYKGLELGPTITMATVLPYQYYKLRKTHRFLPILSRVGTITISTTVLSTVFSIGMMHWKLYKENYNQYKIWDRAYRIRNSQSQIRTDQFSLTFSIIGGFGAFFIGLPKKYHLLSFTKGALMSIPFGILVHMITFKSNK